MLNFGSKSTGIDKIVEVDFRITFTTNKRGLNFFVRKFYQV